MNHMKHGEWVKMFGPLRRNLQLFIEYMKPLTSFGCLHVLCVGGFLLRCYLGTKAVFLLVFSN